MSPWRVGGGGLTASPHPGVQGSGHSHTRIRGSQRNHVSLKTHGSQTNHGSLSNNVLKVASLSPETTGTDEGAKRIKGRKGTKRSSKGLYVPKESRVHKKPRAPKEPRASWGLRVLRELKGT
jgi:hypothetical protein